MTEKHTMMIVCRKCGKAIRAATLKDFNRRTLYHCEKCKAKT